MTISSKGTKAWQAMRQICRGVSWLGVFFPLTLTVSCFSYHAGTNFNMSKVCCLAAGKTSKAQVLQLFGPPTVRIEMRQFVRKRVLFGFGETVQIWQYIYGSGVLFHGVRILQLEFDAAGLLVDYLPSSGFSGDEMPDLTLHSNFDMMLARGAIIPGKSTKAEVATLLAARHASPPINKEGVAERWYFEFSEVSGEDVANQSATKLKRSYGKMLVIDFDAKGIVLHVKGASDFPDDLRREKNKGFTSPLSILLKK